MFAGQPLRQLMDELSLVETLRVRLLLRDKSVKLQHSKADLSEADMCKKNYEFFSGQSALATLREFSNLLQVGEDFTESTGVTFEGLFPLIVRGMADVHRRLYYLTGKLQYKLLAVFDMDLERACSHIASLWNEYKHRPCCLDPHFSAALGQHHRVEPETLNPKPQVAFFAVCLQEIQVIFAFTERGENERRVQAFQNLAMDCLMQLPASSVQIEKMHSNLQLNTFARNRNGRLAAIVQQDTQG